MNIVAHTHITSFNLVNSIIATWEVRENSNMVHELKYVFDT